MAWHPQAPDADIPAPSVLAATARTTKFGFRIRTRHGLLVENLMIHGRDEADAERKLRQMYQHCEILDRLVHEAPSRRAMPSFEEVVSLLSK
jgi:hypothetical protein